MRWRATLSQTISRSSFSLTQIHINLHCFELSGTVTLRQILKYIHFKYYKYICEFFFQYVLSKCMNFSYSTAKYRTKNNLAPKYHVQLANVTFGMNNTYRLCQLLSCVKSIPIEVIQYSKFLLSFILTHAIHKSNFMGWSERCRIWACAKWHWRFSTLHAYILPAELSWKHCELMWIYVSMADT